MQHAWVQGGAIGGHPKDLGGGASELEVVVAMLCGVSRWLRQLSMLHLVV
jgi:hypothetical protein